MNAVDTESPVRVHPLAELVAGLAVAGPDASPDRNYPQALREEAAELVAQVLDADDAAELGPAVRAAGVAGVVCEIILDETHPRRARADTAAHRVLSDLRARVHWERLERATRLPGDLDRLTKMDGDSRYGESPLLSRHARVEMWPVRLLPPAPAGKLFVREVVDEELLQLAFGDLGHVNVEPRLDWPQWYRLGVWHATLNRRWGGAVARVSSPDLEAAFAALPESHRRKVGVHEAKVSVFSSWTSYFLDGLVAAGKVLLEGSVGGQDRAAEQARWFQSLGRLHLEWFLQQLRPEALEDPPLPRLAAAWMESVGELAAVSSEFHGPIAACESPIWNDRVEAVFSPSIDRISRRSLTVWLKGYWPADVAVVAPGAPEDANGACRIVNSLSCDEPWFDALASSISPESRDRWSVLAGRGGGPPRAIVYAYRSQHDPTLWTRVSLASSPEELVRAQRLARPYADWTAVESGVVGDFGRIDYDLHGAISFASTA